MVHDTRAASYVAEDEDSDGAEDGRLGWIDEMGGDVDEDCDCDELHDRFVFHPRRRCQRAAAVTCSKL
jgi:hypothetical protein